ncbi:MAG: hypothetical protein JKY37_18485, partial [Nannocystaceae bacterium]|nr:hypothetical protein [Nannocystaceae bacterium]
TPPRKGARDAAAPAIESAIESSAATPLDDEDAALFALLGGGPPAREQDTELDALLDQVLEFASTPDSRAMNPMELEPEELLQITTPSDVKTKRGDTLSRIRALLPPPPGSGSHRRTSPEDEQTRPRPMTPAPPRRDPKTPPPPPPPRKKKRP